MNPHELAFQWWPTVLLEWDSTVANRCSVIEKSKISVMIFFAIFHFLPLTSLPVARKKTIMK